VLVKAIQRYNINIHTSDDSTDGDWRALTCYPQLCDTFPMPTSHQPSCISPLPTGQPTCNTETINHDNALSRLRCKSTVNPAATKKRNRPKSSTIPDIRQRTLSGYIRCGDVKPGPNTMQRTACATVTGKRTAAEVRAESAHGPEAGGSAVTSARSLSELDMPDNIAVCASQPHVHAISSGLHGNVFPSEFYASSVDHFSSSSSYLLSPAINSTSGTPIPPSSVDEPSTRVVSVDMPQQSMDLSNSLLEYDKGIVFE
jgi:hypothetical protein